MQKPQQSSVAVLSGRFLLSMLGLCLAGSSMTFGAQAPRLVLPHKPQLAAPLRVVQPDLVLLELSLPSPVHEGDPVDSGRQLRFTLQNQGAGASKGTTIQFQGTLGSPSWISGSLQVPGMSPGQVHIGTWPTGSGLTWPSGSYTLTATVDPGNLIHDANVANNRKTFTLAVPPSGALVRKATPLPSLAPGMKAIGLAKPTPVPLPGETGRRLATLDISADPAANTQVGRRTVTLDISANPAANTQVGRRTTTLDISADPAANTQVGRRIAILDITAP